MHTSQTQEKVLNKWTVVDPNTIGINWVQGNISEWTKSEYDLSKQRLCWRDHIIEIEANVIRNYYGATVSVKILYRGNKYRSLFTKYKYMAGSHGDRLPTITTDTHRLHIRPYISGLTLCDMPLSENFTGTTDAFEILTKLDL
jgi:hypothetical protein